MVSAREPIVGAVEEGNKNIAISFDKLHFALDAFSGCVSLFHGPVMSNTRIDGCASVSSS